MVDDQALPVRNQVLAWPMQLENCKQAVMNKNAETPETPGWVIGWKDSWSHVDVTICAGIIPWQAFDKTSPRDDTNKASPTNSTDEGRSINLINSAIRRLRDDDHREHCESKVDHKNCFCPVCVCYESLCVLGYWDPREENNFIETNEDAFLLHPGADDGLRRFYLTDQGPWFTNCQTKPTQDDSCNTARRARQQQLLLFDPFRTNKGNHYSTPCGLDKEALANSMHSRLLLRLGQSDDVFHELQFKGMEIQSETNPQSYKTARNERSSEETNSPSYNMHSNESNVASTPLRWNALYSLFMVQVATNMSRQRHWSGCLALCRFVSCLNSQLQAGRSKKRTFATRQQDVQQSVEALNSTLTAFMDGMLGLLVGIVIIYKRDLFSSMGYTTWSSLHHQLLKSNIGWLETFPVGFKLNLVLTKNMGYEILNIIAIQERLLAMVEASSWNGLSTMATLTGYLSMTFGVSGLLALLFDLIRFSTLHVAMFAAAFRVLYRAELYMLAALWRLCRGKKQNYLRRRTDTMEYDATQLLLGMILFSMVIFLFTTIFFYYMFFALLDLLRNTVLVTIWLACALHLRFPYGSVVLRTMHSGWFASNVYLQEEIVVANEVPPLQKSQRVVTRLASISPSLFHVVWGTLSPCLTVCSYLILSHLKRVVFGERITVLVEECL
jgi:hypothetical protein